MGGYGSGTWTRYGAKLTTNCCFSIDIHWLKKQGYLQKGYITKGTCTQSFRNSGRTLTISLQSVKNRMVLSYNLNSEKMSYTVPVTFTKCHLGGDRAWFKCPNTNCNKRIGKLFLRGKYFLCRHCHNLAYETQNMSDSFRLLEKAQKIRERLGGSLSTEEPFPHKPKGMHWKTYNNLRIKANRNEGIMWETAAKEFGVWGLR